MLHGLGGMGDVVFEVVDVAGSQAQAQFVDEDGSAHEQRADEQGDFDDFSYEVGEDEGGNEADARAESPGGEGVDGVFCSAAVDSAVDEPAAAGEGGGENEEEDFALEGAQEHAKAKASGSASEGGGCGRCIGEVVFAFVGHGEG